jgi:hypothetical protein
MAVPTDEQIDAAVPVEGTPNRGLTNAALKNMAAALRTAPAIITPPTTPTSPGTAGQIAFDAERVYFCVATNTWLSAALSEWA